MSRRGNLLLLISRYAFGFRIIIPAACGALGMPPIRFAVINLIAGILWAVPTALVGFYAGDAAAAIFAGLTHYELWLLLAVAVVAVLVLVTRHLRHAAWVEDLRLADAHRLVPLLIGAMGVVNLLSAIWPRHRQLIAAMVSWFPLEVTQNSRPLMLMAGIALLQVTRNLARRKELAWYVAVIALSVSLLTHITRAFDLHHSVVAALLLGYLIHFRHRFNARSDPLSLRYALVAAPLILGAVFIYAYVGLTHRQSRFEWPPGETPAVEALNASILILEPHVIPLDEHGARFLDSVEIAGWLARFYILLLILRPVVMRRRLEAPGEEVRAVFELHSRFSLSAFAVQPDKHHLQLLGGKGLVGYATRGAVCLACGDPLTPEERFEDGVREYLEYCATNGWIPCVYEAAEPRLPAYQSLGLRSLKMAEEALLELGGFSLAGGKRATLRAMVSKVSKMGFVLRRYRREEQADSEIDEQLEQISEEWLAEKKLGELGFTLGRFSLEAISNLPVFLAVSNGQVQAFCSWLPYRRGEAVVLDLMRKRRGAVSGTMDFLIANSLLELKADGYIDASLANAPLANTAEPRSSLERGVALLFENMNSFYGYKNLFQFKKKFAPRWEGRYLVYPKGADLPRVAYALTSVHRSTSPWQKLLRR
jgi:lysylphosphatidylglycerol synthetase-like protein (DUF2156 family)